MATLVRVGVFLLFLLAYALYLLTTVLLARLLQRNLIRGRQFGPTVLITLTGTGFFVLFVYLLAGFFNLLLLLLLVIGTLLGIGVSAVLWGFMGSTDSKWGVDAFLGILELMMRNPFLVRFNQIVSLAFLIGYPATVGWLYFSQDTPSPVLNVLILQVTLIWFVLIGTISALPSLVGVLTLENLYDDTRARFFTAQFGGLVPTALFFALALGAFRVGGAGVPLGVSGIALTVSPLLVLVIVSYFTVLILVPYLIGLRRAKNARRGHIDERRTWIDRATQILKLPTPATRAGELAGLQQKLNADVAELGADPYIQFITWLDESPDEKIQQAFKADPSLVLLPPEFLTDAARAFRASHEIDPRYSHRESLKALSDDIGKAAQALDKRQSESAERKEAAAWVTYFADLGQGLDREAKDAEAAKPMVWAVAAFVCTPIITAVLNVFGAYAAALVSQYLQ